MQLLRQTEVYLPDEPVTSNIAHQPGGRASALYAAPGMEALSGQADLAAAYITQLKEQAAAVLGSTVAATLVPIQYNGDFNWSWSDGTTNVNQPSYNYISGAVSPSTTQAGTYQVGGGGSFANLYQQLINGIAWQFSAADSATMQQAQTQSQTQGASVVSTYVAAFGAPTAAQMQTAQQVNPLIASALDYIVLYEAGYLWAGQPKGSMGLSLFTMQQTQNLRTLLQYAPPSAQPVIQAISMYLNALGGATRLMDMQSLGTYTLQQLKNNLTPSATNGGINLFNPPTSNYYLGYSSNKTTSQILQELSNTSQQVTLQFSASQSSQSSYNVSFSGGASLGWAGDLLDISAGTSFRGDVARQSGSGSDMNISMVYPGVTIIPFTPAAFQQTSGGSTGWWYEAIIRQAWDNLQQGSSAESGFTFVNGVPGGIQLGQDGLGYLSAIVVSGYPTITIEFSEGSYDDFSSWLSTHTDVSVSLFGFIPMGSASIDTYQASMSHSQSGSGFTLTLTPPAPGSSGQTIPVQAQTVPVLAGQVFPVGVSQS